MERTHLRWISLRRFIIFLILSLNIAYLNQVYAGVILAPPPAPPSPPLPGEDFPESRFGAPPQKINLRAESEDGDEEEGERSPAGLEFDDGLGRGQAKPIIGVKEIPQSPANLNPKPAPNSRVGIQEVSLIAGDLGFFPKTVFVTQDIPVRMYITGASKKTLCIMMDSFQIRRQLHTQKVEEIVFTPHSAGQFRFYCPINGMEGTLLVKEPKLSFEMKRTEARE